MYGMQQYPLEPARISPIVRPGTPKWVTTFTPTNEFNKQNALHAALVLVPVIVGFGLLTQQTSLVGVGPALILLGIFGPAVLTMAAMFRLRGNVVSAPDYKYEGVAIEGKALDMLADIQHRFAWAEKMFGRVPTGIRWSEVADQVQVLLWEAAEHAAKVSALDHELGQLGYATEGSPQGVLRARLRRQRAAIWTQLENTQYEADDLAREASNTAAAARVALARTGSVYDLELLAPTGASLVARGTLAAARARLALLAEVWTELDETHELTAARLELDSVVPSGDQKGPRNGVQQPEGTTKPRGPRRESD